MTNVVKYRIYLDVLLMGSIDVMKSTCLRESPILGQNQIFKKAAQPKSEAGKSIGQQYLAGIGDGICFERHMICGDVHLAVFCDDALAVAIPMWRVLARSNATDTMNRCVAFISGAHGKKGRDNPERNLSEPHGDSS